RFSLPTVHGIQSADGIGRSRRLDRLPPFPRAALETEASGPHGPRAGAARRHFAHRLELHPRVFVRETKERLGRAPASGSRGFAGDELRLAESAPLGAFDRRVLQLVRRCHWLLVRLGSVLFRDELSASLSRRRSRHVRVSWPPHEIGIGAARALSRILEDLAL